MPSSCFGHRLLTNLQTVLTNTAPVVTRDLLTRHKIKTHRVLARGKEGLGAEGGGRRGELNCASFRVTSRLFLVFPQWANT